MADIMLVGAFCVYVVLLYLWYRKEKKRSRAIRIKDRANNFAVFYRTTKLLIATRRY